MSSSDLPKLWSKPTKIGHIFRKYNKYLKKKFTCKSWSPSLIFFIEKNSERFGWFFMLKKYFESQNFAIFEEVVQSFGRSDDDII
jgi:hypothetical protein